MKLFEVIDSQKKYDTQKILQNGDFNKNNQLPTLKNYLHNLLLRSLELYHSGADVDSELKNYLQRVKILFEKGLYKECSIQLLKAKKKAYEFEKYPQILEILDWEIALLTEQGISAKSGELIKGIINEQDLVLEKFVNERKYKRIRNIIVNHCNLNNAARNQKEAREYKKIISNDLCSKEEMALSYNAKNDFYYIHNVYSSMTGDTAKSYAHLKKQIQLLESNPIRLTEQYVSYVKALANFRGICLAINRFDEGFEAVKKIRAIPAKSIKMASLIFNIASEAELDFHLKTGKVDKLSRFVKEVETGIKLYKEQIPNSNICSLYFGLSYLYLINENYLNSLKWLNRILNDQELKDLRTDIHCIAHIINLIIHYELGNQDLLEYIVKSTYRYLYKRNRLYEYENSILNFIRKKVPNILTVSQQINGFKELKSELERIIKDPYEKQVLDYFDLISWLECKIKNRPFADVIGEKLVKIRNVSVR